MDAYGESRKGILVMPTFRRATNEEIAESFDVKHGYKVRFEHGAREVSDSRTETGVRHIRFGRSVVQMVNGVPHVHYRNKLEPVKATIIFTEGCKPYVGCFKLAGLS